MPATLTCRSLTTLAFWEGCNLLLAEPLDPKRNRSAIVRFAGLALTSCSPEENEKREIDSAGSLLDRTAENVDADQIVSFEVRCARIAEDAEDPDVVVWRMLLGEVEN